MNIKFKEARDVKGFLASLCECVGVFTAYLMVFYFFWEGLLAAAGAK